MVRRGGDGGGGCFSIAYIRRGLFIWCSMLQHVVKPSYIHFIHHLRVFIYFLVCVENYPMCVCVSSTHSHSQQHQTVNPVNSRHNSHNICSATKTIATRRHSTEPERISQSINILWRVYTRVYKQTMLVVFFF